jgi:hypothetical protein
MVFSNVGTDHLLDLNELIGGQLIVAGKLIDLPNLKILFLLAKTLIFFPYLIKGD